MGNDEHSLNVFKKAEELGVEPARLLRHHGAQSSKTFGSKLDISFDDFIRTTEPRHTERPCKSSCGALHDAGDVFESKYEGWYCNSCEAFKPEKDLVDGNCPLHQTKPEWLERA